MYVNGKMRPIETIPEKKVMIEGLEFNYDIL
jgi:hypothetical protein